MKEKTAKIIRIVTIPPIEALVMLLILYGVRRTEFGNADGLLVSILFLALIPACAYPVSVKMKNKEDIRSNQRNMAFTFNFLSYFVGMLTGRLMECSELVQWILLSYFLSVLILTVMNKVFHIKASGHACSCALPYMFLSQYLGRYVAAVCLLLYFAEFWASVELKRHTMEEFLQGSAVAAVVFAVTMSLV